MEIEDEVDLLMSTDILAAQISTKSISFTRAQSGWIFREDRKVRNIFDSIPRIYIFLFKELVAGQYESELYTVNGLVLESRKRREHLSTDDLQKNKAILESFTKGGQLQNFDQNGEVTIQLKCEIHPFVRETKMVFENFGSVTARILVRGKHSDAPGRFILHLKNKSKAIPLKLENYPKRIVFLIILVRRYFWQFILVF